MQLVRCGAILSSYSIYKQLLNFINSTSLISVVLLQIPQLLDCTSTAFQHVSLHPILKYNRSHILTNVSQYLGTELKLGISVFVSQIRL